MAPRKKRKSNGKISSVKQNKKNRKKTTPNKKDSIQDITNEVSTPVPNSEENNSEKSKATRPVQDMKAVEDENILSADFIPLSATPVQNRVRSVSDNVETNPTAEVSEVPVTIIVDDNDAESVCVDDSGTDSDNESGAVNDSIQIVGETGKLYSGRIQSDQGNLVNPNSANRKVPLSEAKKRKLDDSIEILDTVDSVSNRRKKARINKRLHDTSVFIISNSDDETPESHDQDDDIMIVETIDNNSRGNVQVMNDYLPLKMSSALAREKTRRNKTFQKRNHNHWNIAQKQESIGGVSSSLVTQDTIGITPGSTHYKSPLKHIANQDSDTNVTYHNVYGNNVYNPNSVQKTGLRPVVIDGSNVAFRHGGKSFSTRGIEICVNYFVKRGHMVVAFVPLFRRSEVSDADRKILDDLKDKNQLAFTPSRYLSGRRVTSYDDRFIVQCAAELGGIVVSTDNYRDLLGENEAWRETIEKRLLMFTWVGDLLMFPDDPNGRGGPRLEEFLRFPQ